MPAFNYERDPDFFNPFIEEDDEYEPEYPFEGEGSDEEDEEE